MLLPTYKTELMKEMKSATHSFISEYFDNVTNAKKHNLIARMPFSQWCLYMGYNENDNLCMKIGKRNDYLFCDYASIEMPILNGAIYECETTACHDNVNYIVEKIDYLLENDGE